MSYKFYTEATSIQLEVGNAFSVQKIYRTSACAVPSFFAYVSVTKGVALSVTWDENACSLCGSSDCVDDNCCTPHSTCLTSVDCDIKIYLGWSGTDINDATLQSKDNFLSNFRRYSAASLYNDVTQSASNSVNDAIGV
eukprot:516602_1